MSWFVNVNKHVIAQNARDGTELPPVRVSKGKSGAGTYCNEVELPAGSRIIYDAATPILKCGARLVIECPTKPTIIK